MPGAELALVPWDKLFGYCLNPTHPQGRHKARVFRASLGMKQEDAERLRGLILEGVRHHEAHLQGSTPHGDRYVVDLPLMGLHAQVWLRTVWQFLPEEGIPRLITCWVLEGGSA